MFIIGNYTNVEIWLFGLNYIFIIVWLQRLQAPVFSLEYCSIFLSSLSSGPTDACDRTPKSKEPPLYLLFPFWEPSKWHRIPIKNMEINNILPKKSGNYTPDIGFSSSTLLINVLSHSTHLNFANNSYKKNQDYFPKEQTFLKNRIRLFGKGVAFKEGQQWSKNRKILSSLFHFSYFNNFITVISDIVDRQINNIAIQSDFEAIKTAQTIAGNTVVKTFFGVSFNQKIQDQTMAVWLSNLLSDNVAQERTIRHFLFGQSILKLGLFAEDRNMNRRIQQFRTIAKDAIQNKIKQPENNKGTILDAIREKGLLGTPEGLSLDQLLQEFMGFFVAGADTTSHLIAMSFYYLTTQPGLQQELRQEMKTANVINNLNYKNISSLKKLQQFLKEVFRHYSYILSIFPRNCLKKTQIGDITINQGDLVMTGWVYLNFNPDCYPNPQVFDIKRWEKNDNKTHPYLFTPFSIGARGCLGQHFALLETKIVILKFLNQFEMKLKEGYDLKLSTRSLYGPVNPMHIKIKENA